MDEHLLQKQCKGFVNTPPLWFNEQFSVEQFQFPDIDLSLFEPMAIRPNIRLGHQMEYVFKQLIEHSSAYEVLLHNLPVRKEKRTIGEIDFILKNLNATRLIHVELTYKFYVINTEITEPVHQLMGPNKNDMFFTKMEKIRDKQFPLLYTPEATSALRALDIDTKGLVHQACFKAQLFTPYHSKSAHIRPLNKKCIAGYWLRFDTFNTDDFKKHKFYIPYKTEWVIAPHIEVDWSSHFNTLMDVNIRLLKENSPMVWMKKNDTEFKKFFIVWW